MPGSPSRLSVGSWVAAMRVESSIGVAQLDLMIRFSNFASWEHLLVTCHHLHCYVSFAWIVRSQYIANFRSCLQWELMRSSVYGSERQYRRSHSSNRRISCSQFVYKNYRHFTRCRSCVGHCRASSPVADRIQSPTIATDLASPPSAKRNG